MKVNPDNVLHKEPRMVREDFENRTKRDAGMNKLQELISLCKYEVQIYVNRYKYSYQTILQGIEDVERDAEEPLTSDIKKGMIETENIVNIDCYPFTPISSLSIYHYDINAAIDEAIESVIEWQKERDKNG